MEAYRNAVKRAGVAEAFTFTGYVSYEALPALYEQMSVFVAPVHTESFGQVTPFAMSMGITIVGYDVGALREIIGDESLLAPQGTATGWPTWWSIYLAAAKNVCGLGRRTFGGHAKASPSRPWWLVSAPCMTR